MQEESKTSKLMIKIIYIYLSLPFFLFMMGWVKLYITVPALLIVIFCMRLVFRDAPKIWTPEITRDNIIKILFIIGIIAIWVYLSGIGKFVFQNEDHAYRNTIFNLLVEEKWPVAVSKISGGESSLRVMVYYIGFWLPSAIVGKVFGLRCGYYFQAVWALVGIVLVYYLVCAIFKRLSVWPLFLIIFFSGLDIIGEYLIGTDFHTMSSSLHLEWWSIPYQFSSMTTQLFWVFNQAIPAWLCTALICIDKKNRSLVFILSFLMLSSTMPFIGVFLLVAFMVLKRSLSTITDAYKHNKQSLDAKIRKELKDIFTVQNVLGGGIVGITSFLYLFSNTAGTYIMKENTRGPQFDDSIMKWLVFLIVEIGVYCVVLYKYHKSDGLFYFIVGCLCIMPWIRVGYSNDFCMRATVPMLFILMLMVIDALYKSYHSREYAVFAALIIAVIIGSFTPVHEFTRTISETTNRLNNAEIVYSEDVPVEKIMGHHNFSAEIDDGIFFKYMMKKGYKDE